MLENQEDSRSSGKATQTKPKKAEPVYIIDDEDDDDDDDEDHHQKVDDIDAILEEEEDETIESSPPLDLQSPPSYADTDSDCFDRRRGRYTSDSESDCRPYKPSRSGRSTPEYGGGHRKSVSFDLSGDERSRSDYERSRSRTPDGYSRSYDSEQDTRGSGRNRLPRKGILRATSPCSTLEKAEPIVPAVARIREVESPQVQRVSRATSPERPGELERENPFRQPTAEDDEYTRVAKAVSKSPRSPRSTREQFFFGSSRSSEDLLEQSQSQSSGRSTPNTVISKSTESLTGTRPKVPPPTPPKPQLKKADLVRNVALETFQASDVGQGGFTVFEHDASTNTIHPVEAKLPVRVVPKTKPSRPRESPPPPPVNFATLPKMPTTPTLREEESLYMEALPPTPSQLRPHDFVHENSPDNILVTPQEHREYLLRENELRNQLRAPYEPAPPIPIAGDGYSVTNPFLDSCDTDIDSLPLPPPPTPPAQQQSRHLHEPPFPPLTANASSSPSFTSSAATAAAAAAAAATTNRLMDSPQQLLVAGSPTQIFPTAQILPVQYASLPQPQQANTLTLKTPSTATHPHPHPDPATASVGANAPALFNLVLVPGDQSNSTSPAAVLYLQPSQLPPVSESSGAPSKQARPAPPPPPTDTVTSPTPSYAAMKFPTFSEIVVSPDVNSNYQNMTTARVGFSNSSLGNSTSSFSIDSSSSSLAVMQTKGPGEISSSYYETAEEIYSTIEEEAIYSNTSFFDSRRSSDTSLSCRASTSPTPPPLPPKRPLKPTKLRTAPVPPPVAHKPHGLRGLASFKLRSQSQPQLVGSWVQPPVARTPTTPTGKETTV